LLKGISFPSGATGDFVYFTAAAILLEIPERQQNGRGQGISAQVVVEELQKSLARETLHGARFFPANVRVITPAAGTLSSFRSFA
jgi:hypothetical protein